MIQKIDAKDICMPQSELWEAALDEYSKEKNLPFKKYAFYLAKSEDANPDNTGLILVRVALSDLENKISQHKKYVIMQTYYDNGDLSTIDIVKLPKDYHKEIVIEYLTRILSPELSREFASFVPIEAPEGVNERAIKNIVQEDMLKNVGGQSRFLTAGGYAEGDEKNIKFYGSSGDFLDTFSTYNVNEISSYLLSQTPLAESFEPVENAKGKEYIERCLDIMMKHKLKADFYSQLVDFYLIENVKNKKLTGDHLLYALIMMKSMDRAIMEGKSPLQILTEEMVEGIGREMMIKSVAERMKIRD